MPAWMPGFYSIMHYARMVSGFQALNGRGQRLGWQRVTPHTWRVVTANNHVVVIRYDVAATRPFVADNSLSDSSAFVAPPGLFMYVAGQLLQPVTVQYKLPQNWRRVACGLAPVPGHPDTFSAPNFNLLLDSPALLGNQETLHFRVGGRLHTVAMEYVPASVSRPKLVSDLRRIVLAATGMMGVIPYPRYTFLLIGHGDGGIEHLTSAAISFNGRGLTRPAGYTGWLSYVAHEYFHTFNVKRIRPLALGPFDYETENLTHMLWVSEGLTVYYEDILLVRAGLITPAQYLHTLQGEINAFENEPGRPYESATESSWRTWNGGYGGRTSRNTTISYYDNGGILGAMLDLTIRHDSHNAKSLDDVMRFLYRRYYVRDRRGFTDAEFRQACEAVAGRPLPAVFRDASTSAPIDYKKFFGYAGIRVQVAAQPEAGASLGLDTDTRGVPAIAAVAPPGPFRDGSAGQNRAQIKLLVSGVAPGSPAQNAGLQVGDQLLTLNGSQATAASLSALLNAGKPGQQLTIGFVAGGERRQAQVTLAPREKLVFQLRRMPNANPLQAATLRQWLSREPGS